VKALVARKPQTITWDGGRPLPIDGTGGLDLTVAGARLSADPAGLRWELDGAVRRFVPGKYEAKFTVAVGASGLGAVHDNGVAFESDGNALMETKGGAFIALPPRALHIEGPGSVVITGNLSVRTDQGTRQTDGVGFGPGSYVIDLTPAPGGYTIAATLQGPID
jgi:hypothetical protein